MLRFCFHNTMVFWTILYSCQKGILWASTFHMLTLSKGVAQSHLSSIRWLLFWHTNLVSVKHMCSGVLFHSPVSPLRLLQVWWLTVKIFILFIINCFKVKQDNFFPLFRNRYKLGLTFISFDKWFLGTWSQSFCFWSWGCRSLEDAEIRKKHQT